METFASTPRTHSLLNQRWSPRAFNPHHALDREQITSLLEAARWAPSANNTQPWRFLYGLRGDATFAALVASLNPGNVRWAPRASALVLAIARLAKPDGSPLLHAGYDLGQAVAHLTIQAQALGLATHQMGGFVPAKARKALSIPDQFQPMTIVAIGERAEPEGLLEEDLLARERAPRKRQELSTIAHNGIWSESLG